MTTISTESLKQAALDAIEAHLDSQRSSGNVSYIELEISLADVAVTHTPTGMGHCDSDLWARYKAIGESSIPFTGAIHVWALVDDEGRRAAPFAHALYKIEV